QVRLSARNMVDFINKKDLSDTDLRWSIQVFVSNIINEFLFGFQFPFDDCEKLMNFVLGLNTAIQVISRSKLMPIIFMLPWIRHLPIISYFWGKHKERFDKVSNF
ncbi:hypothetical protein PMAYCL1PPCAC_24648, partial [Pristionchus mayeri]